MNGKLITTLLLLSATHLYGSDDAKNYDAENYYDADQDLNDIPANMVRKHAVFNKLYGNIDNNYSSSIRILVKGVDVSHENRTFLELGAKPKDIRVQLVVPNLERFMAPPAVLCAGALA